MKRLIAWLILFPLLVAGCRAAPDKAPVSRVEETSRLAVLSAFEPELQQLLKQTKVSGRYEINGRTFTTGRLGDHEVVLFLSGTSMVNAAMTTQAALDHFHIAALLFTGIAGGVNPDLHIGDVVIPGEWAEYQDQVFARQTEKGWDTSYHSSNLGHFGMMFPQPVSVARAGGRADAEESKFWFAVDAQMLAAARKAAAQVQLKRCPTLGPCLTATPQVKVGGKGLSGPTFVDNADYRSWAWENFHADALDMESAAVAHVAYANRVPFLAFRSLSDLAGGGSGQNELPIFMLLAANNSAATVMQFLAAYP